MPLTRSRTSSRQWHQSALTIFQEPYAQWTPQDILEHFRSRESVTYFPVIDPVETRREKIENILDDTFEFNGEVYHNLRSIPWLQNPSQDVEWLILLHKFYYAVGLGMAFGDTQDQKCLNKWVELTESWINLVPLNFLPSDVAGRRIQNWIFAHYFFVTQEHTARIDSDFYLKFLSSLSQQVSYLCTHLTPARNHRTLELCSIFLAGVVFPELREASNWLELAKTELVKNIQSDLLPDGVHCELSTDYHHLVLKNFLWVRRLAVLNQITFPAIVDEKIQKALEFSLYVHKPDGTIPSLGDGDSRNFLDLLEQGFQLYGNQEFRYVASQGVRGTPPQERSKEFSHSGYYILRSGWGDGSEPYEGERYLIFDCGPLGAGNHGHFDLLSFEMAAYGKSLIIDPGRYTYDESGQINWRVRFRETAAHNTVLIDGKNQTRYVFDKTRFKIKGPQPDFRLQKFTTQPGFDFLHGIAKSHEYRVIHERKIFFVLPDYWILSDLIIAEDPHDYDLLFHLSDEAWGQTSCVASNDSLIIHAPHLILAQPLDANIQPTIQDSYISRMYGTKHQAPIVKLSSRQTSMCYHTVIMPYKTEAPGISVQKLPVFHDDRSCTPNQASALCIKISRDDQIFHDYYFVRHSSCPGEYAFDRFAHDGATCLIRTNGADTFLRRYVVG